MSTPENPTLKVRIPKENGIPQKPLGLRRKNESGTKVLYPSDHELPAHLVDEWIVLPNKESYGLPLSDLRRHWDNLRVDVFIQKEDGTWGDYFDES